MATVVQRKCSATVTSLSSTPTNLTFDASATAGNAIVVVVTIGQTGSTIGVSDAVNGTYSSGVTSDSGADIACIKWFRDVQAVSTISVTSSVTGNGVIFLYEVSGLDNSIAVTTGTKTNTAVTTHNSAASGISGTNGFTVTGAELAAGQPPSAGAGYTEFTESPSDARFSQWRTTTISNDTGDFTTAASDNSAAAMAYFAEASTGTVGVQVLRKIRRKVS